MNTIPQDSWPANGIATLAEFELHRALTLRATQQALKTICDTYLNDVASILEIGSGIGFMARNIPSEYHNRWMQLEAQPVFLKEAKQRHPFGLYITATAYNLPFPDNSLDAICGYSSFDVLSDLDTTISEVHRTLKPKGIFIHLLDLGADYENILRDFQQKRIPCYVKSESDSLFPCFGTKNTTFSYIPQQHLNAFVADVEMTSEEMAALPVIDSSFAFPYFQRKYNCGPDGIIDYFHLFDKYAVKLDTNNYFHTKLTTSLRKYFPAQSIEYKTIIAQTQGKRTAQQIQTYPDVYVYEKTKGTTHFGICTFPQLPQYHIHNLLKHKLPKIASFLEPFCTEIVTLEYVIAKKSKHLYSTLITKP